MADAAFNSNAKLLELIEKTGYNIMQNNGQRKFGPPPDWNGAPPPKGCEVFVGKLPREIYEDELVPIFSNAGKIYEMRLMMDFSGSNRGYAFVTYTNRRDAAAAVRQLNGFEIRPGKNIGVVKSVDNCRLFIGGIPKNKTKEEIVEELTKHVNDIVDVILYRNCFDRRLNRGFAFVEFTSHRAAAMARRQLVPGCFKLWDQEVMVDWAEPEPDVDEEQMKKVKVLYVRNLLLSTSKDQIEAIFEKAAGQKIQRVKKIYDYAFIHFYERSHAEQAMASLKNSVIDGVKIEIRWAKPVDREVYRLQKLTKGNAKFNKGLDFSQTLLLYKQHLEKREYANSPKEDEGIGSGCAGESSCSSPVEGNPFELCYMGIKTDLINAPSKLEAMCKRYTWAPPVYDYQRFKDALGGIVWVGKVELPHVGLPLLTIPRRIGPLNTRPCPSKQAAYIEAADQALQCIKVLRADLIQRSTPNHISMTNQMSPPTPMPQPHLAHATIPSLYSTIMPNLQSCMGLPYEYINSFYQRPPPSVNLPTMWRAV